MPKYCFELWLLFLPLSIAINRGLSLFSGGWDTIILVLYAHIYTPVLRRAEVVLLAHDQIIVSIHTRSMGRATVPSLP
ncbi:hypothetical protein F5I97DRAFT_263652 [Phlebopus sp. FC_14]|nr:hypothetical protein F5I97DRAFT_263652 [Phlebopus sp. FC_14]